MKNFSIKIKTSILMAFSFVMFFIISTIVSIQYKSGQEFALLTTQQAFNSITDKVINQIEKYDLASDNFITILKNINEVQSLPKENKTHPLLKVITEYINKSNHTYGVYVGYKDDHFYQVINMNVSDNIKEFLNVPQNSRWLEVSHIIKDKKIIRIEKALDKNLKLIRKEIKNTQYKPSQRPWYIKALKTDQTIKTQPYIFTSLQKPGVSYAKMVSKDTKTIIGLDISLDSLSQILKEQNLVDKSGAYIFKKDGMVIGQADSNYDDKINNLNTRYENYFISNGKVKEINQQNIISLFDKEYIKYSKKLVSKFGIEEYITIFSPLDTIMKPYKQKIYTTLQFTIFIIILLVLPVTYLTVRLITKPILKLEDENKKIKDGKFDKVEPIESFMIEINSLSRSMVSMSKAIEQNQRTLESKVQQRTKEIEDLLNNAGQGFLSFDENMIIGKKYSQEAFNIFEEEIGAKNITHLLYEDKEKREFVTATLQGILKDDPIRQEILISLLDKEFYINGKDIEVEYKILDEHNYMMILTDITAKKELAKQIQQEQQILKMVVEVITNLEQFLEIKEDYEKFVSQIENFDEIKNLQSLRNSIHTYKGLFAQKEMLYIVDSLHEFESHIDTSIKEQKVSSQISTMSKDTMLEWIYNDIEILKSVLGEDFFEHKNSINIDTIRIEDILEKIKILVKEDDKLNSIYKEVEKLSYHNIKTFLKPYEKLVEQLAQRLEKYIEPLEIQCDDIYISDRYKPFLNSLVHIFRNSVDHGIEPLDQRYDLEKSEYASIQCEVNQKENQIVICISDDGSGIDTQKIKTIALEKGIYTKDQLATMDEEDILMIIFDSGFSTAKDITNISGRGIGLASILEELNKLNGKIKIENFPSKGIRFIFEIPYQG